MGEMIFKDFSEYKALREKADEALVAACAAAAAADLDKTFSFTGREDQPRTLSYGGNLLALLYARGPPSRRSLDDTGRMGRRERLVEPHAFLVHLGTT